MGKCTCTISAGSAFSREADRPSAEEISSLNWPMKCGECGKEIASPDEAGHIGDFNTVHNPNEGIHAICPICLELVDCFFCSCKRNSLWPVLREKYNTIGLGNLTELLSPEAKAVVIEKVDQWFLEDNEDEDPRRGIQR